MPQPDGSIFKVKRRPILRDNACPCFLPNFPTYLSSHPTSTKPERLDPDHIDLHILKRPCNTAKNNMTYNKRNLLSILLIKLNQN